MTSILSHQQGKAVVLREGVASREAVVIGTVPTGGLPAGTLLTQSGDAGAATFAMDDGATGNPTSGTITVTGPAVPGSYKVTFTAATKFDVDDPNGVRVGSGTVGSAFSKGGLAFTLTAGGNAAVAGDGASITVAAGDGKYAAYDDGNSADAVLLFPVPAGTDVKATAVVRNALLNRHELELADLDADAAVEALKAKGIFVDGTEDLPAVSTPAL